MNLRRNKPRRDLRGRICAFTPEGAVLIVVILILFVLLFNTFCRLGKCAEVGPYESSVLVQASRSGGPEAFAGSGTAIDEHYVITCFHVVRDSTKYRIYIHAKKKWVRAELAAYAYDPDIAILYTPEKLDYAVLGELDGTTLTGYGFAGSQTLYKTDGKLDQHLQFENGDLSCTIDWRSGDSGGGIFIGDKFVGVGWGSSREYTGVSNCVFAPIRRIRSALRNWCQTGRLRPSRPYFGIEIENTQNNCQPGMGCYRPGNGGSNRVPAGNNPYSPNPIPDDERPPVATNPPKTPVQLPTQPTKEITEINCKLDEINGKISGIEQKVEGIQEKQAKQEEILGELVEIKNRPEPVVVLPSTPITPEITPVMPGNSGTLPNGKFRVKVSPKQQ